MKKVSILIAIMVLLITRSGYPLKFVAYGDSRTQPNIHKQVVQKFAPENPELIIHCGDLWDDYTSSEWKSHFTDISNIASLLTNNKILVARGNHETESAVLNFSPSIVKSNNIEFSYREGNCFFVSMGYDPGANNSWLETQLQSPESQNADWRFIYAHKPVYSTGNHGANGTTSEGSNVTNFRSLCDQYEVTMFFAGHDHLYERTHLIKNGQTVSEQTEVNISETPGTFYVVTGGGGAPLNNTGSEWWVNVNEKMYHYCVINASSGRLEYAVKDINGSTFDAVTITKDTGPFATLSVPNGGEKWEQRGTYSIIWSDNIDENVKIELFKGGALNSTIVNSTESDGEYEWGIPEGQEVGDDYKIKITSVVSDTVFGQSSANFSIEAEYILSVPYVQNFDTLNTGEVLPEKWEQLSIDDFNWKVWTGNTPSGETGPQGDHTSGNGNYLYTEASNPNNPNKKAGFMTPKFNISFVTNLELTFWSHMYSNQNEMGDLYLDVEIDGSWNNDVIHLADDHGEEWFETTEDLSTYTGDRMRLRFRGITGAGSKSDICIDDIRVAGEIVAITMNNKSSDSPVSLKQYGSGIHYSIAGINRKVSIKLYDVKGKLIRTLVDDMAHPGDHFITLNTVTDSKPISGGLYLCRMEIGGFNKTISIIIRE
jgi:predicted phosphodiesterase